MSMSAVVVSRAALYCGILSIRLTRRYIFTYKMSEKPADYSVTNGFESKTPFLIGVAGGTASGKVCSRYFTLNNFIDF